ncbi:hypothetical protein JKP88DRAFT_326855 [Tribonema minus]|uniref:Uncharacterized protein n=1 Tax=Tribonema minus TaxID=303371 RepID=A0A836CBW5_9STRA|nr:hypothetical protein JKP88DRAFT_326855 [Tribonema minus]
MVTAKDGHALVVKALYRMLLHHARTFDKCPTLKAIIPSPLPLPMMVLLGGRDRDFYGARRSCWQAAQASEWRRVTSGAAAALAARAQRAPLLGYGDVYGDARLRDGRLDAALRLFEEAHELEDGAFGSAQRLPQQAALMHESLAAAAQPQPPTAQQQRVIELYENSLRAHATADAHARLATCHAVLRDWARALEHYERSAAADGDLGNGAVGVGLCLMRLGRGCEAEVWLAKAKGARRFNVPLSEQRQTAAGEREGRAPRRFNVPLSEQLPYLNLAALYLQQRQPERALQEYVVALAIAEETGGDAQAIEVLRGVVCDMAGVLTRANTRCVNAEPCPG